MVLGLIQKYLTPPKFNPVLAPAVFLSTYRVSCYDTMRSPLPPFPSVTYVKVEGLTLEYVDNGIWQSSCHLAVTPRSTHHRGGGAIL